MTLRTRLALWYGALLGVILAVAVGVSYFAHADAHVTDDDQMLSRASGPIVAAVGASIAAGHVPTSGDLAAAIPPAPELGVALVDPRGRIVASSGTPDLSVIDAVDLSLGDVFTTTHLPGERARLLVQTVSPEGWRVVVGTSLSELDRSLGALGSQLIWIVVAGIVVALAGGSVIAEGALHPIASVTETADAIRFGRSFTRRVRVPDRDDEVGRLARTFNGMLDTLQEMYERQRRFVSDASHEMRTPLTSVRANVELLAKARGEGERAEMVQKVDREVDRLCRLVDELLLLARADAGQEPFRPSPVQLDEIVMQAFEDLRERAGDRLRVVDLAGATVAGERDRLRELLLILLDNAIKYTPPPRPIEMSLVRDEDGVTLSVLDEGIGIHPDEQARLFDRFFRGDRARRLDPTGSGLGLAIARWIVERHGGTIGVEARAPHGTRVVVRLPLAPAPATYGARESRTANSASGVR